MFCDGRENEFLAVNGCQRYKNKKKMLQCLLLISEHKYEIKIKKYYYFETIWIEEIVLFEFKSCFSFFSKFGHC